MGRARRARRIAATAAYGGGGLAATAGALGALGYGLIKVEARIARRIVGRPFDGAPDDDRTYGAGVGTAIDVVMLGDSSAAGMGADTGEQTVGGIVCGGLAALTGRPVRLTNEAVIGSESGDLERQLANALDRLDRAPDVALILVGANDVTHRIDRSTAVRHLEGVVRRLRGGGTEVVVGTCPDLGTVQPIPHPLKALLRRWSRDLAAAQTVAVVEAGGRTVSLGDLLGAEFETSPAVLFSKDQFHPSPAGYARVAAVLLPTVCAALGIWTAPGQATDRMPLPRRGEAVTPVAVAAGAAVRRPGTEVSGTDVGGTARGPRGRWAVRLRRGQAPVPAERVGPGGAEPADARAEGIAGGPVGGRPEGMGPGPGAVDRDAGEPSSARPGGADDAGAPPAHTGAEAANGS
ncbi:MAG: SGNH/GDSL hydrolase family protein [Dermatophilaceae bacterium]